MYQESAIVDTFISSVAWKIIKNRKNTEGGIADVQEYFLSLIPTLKKNKTLLRNKAIQ